MRKVFIVGVGRSGTSLLQSMLHSHPQIHFLPETQFLRNYQFGKTLSIPELVKRLTEDKHFERLPSSKKKKLFSNLKNNKYRTALEVYVDFYDELSEEVTMIGDKDPRILDYLPELKKAFPKAKVIHIYRDPRDVVLSKTKADWSKHRSYWQHALIGQIQLVSGRKNGLKYFEDDFIELQYEDLIKRPERVLSQLCKRLEIPYKIEMLNFQNAAKQLVDDSELQWKKETMRPLITENKNKWMSEFSNFQVTVIEAFSSVWFEQLGYTSSRKNWFLKLGGRVLTGCASWLYKWKL